MNRLFTLLVFLAMISSCQVPKSEIVVSGQIVGLSDTTLQFSGTPLEWLAEDTTLPVTVDAEGFFRFELDSMDIPLKGFLSFGKVPRTYRFTVQTVEGKDSSMQVPSVDFRMVYLYLEPGDKLEMQVDVQNIPGSLHFNGTGSVNNRFLNQEAWRFDDYKHRYLGNYYWITNYDPDGYKDQVRDLLEKKQQFLNGFSDSVEFSSVLEAYYRANIHADYYRRMIHFPSAHAGFNQDQPPVLPDDYYDYLDEIEIEDEIGNKGAGYLSFLQLVFQIRFDYLQPPGSRIPDPGSRESESGNRKSLYAFILEQLPGERGYQLLGYMLGRDFNRELYDYFDSDCPYPELAKRVHEHFGHLEAMLPGRPAPDFTMEDVNGNRISLDDFRGQYVFLDFWATWCKPCIKQFPALERIQEEMIGKPIVFIGISIDKAEDKETWRQFVKDHGLKGIQVWADQDTHQRLSGALNMRTIPRFVLIDPDGYLVDADAPRPTSQELRGLLKGLLEGGG